MNTTKFKYPLNLQLFALNANGVEESELDDAEQDGDESEDNLDDGEIEHEFADDDTESDDDEDDAEQNDDTTDEEDSTDDDQDDKTSQKGNKGGKGNNATAAAVIAERKKWQAKLDIANKQAGLAAKIMHLSGASSIEEMQRRIDEVEANNLAEQTGITAEMASRQISERREIDDMKQQIKDQKYALEFQTLKKDPFYADIETYKEEYQEIASRTGMSLEEVYLSKRGRERMKERETEIASRVNANKDKRQSKKVNTSSSGGGGGGSQSSTKKLNLTPEQRQAAEYGVKKGYFKSVEEYAKYQ